MPDPNKPSPRRKGRAGIAVVVIVLVIVAAIFVGMNVWYAQEPEEAPGAAQTN